MTPFTIQVLPLLMGMLFMSSAISKWWDRDYFLTSVHVVGLVPVTVAAVLSYVVPYIESVCAFCLFVPSYRRIGAYLSLGLVGCFLLYISVALILERPMSCGCFGSKLVLHSWYEQGMLDIFIILAQVIYLRKTRENATI